MTLKKSLIPFQMPSQSPLIRAVTVLIMFLIVLIAVSTTVLIVFHTISKIFLIEFQTMSQTDLRVFMDPSDRKSTRLNSSHVAISYAVFCLQKKIFDKIYIY